MTTKKLSSETSEQCRRVLAWLREKPLSTLQARQEIEVYHPAARVLQLRRLGHHIVTEWAHVDTPRGSHRIAKYVLLASL